MGKNLVLVGGGHAHMVTLENIAQFTEKGIGVTVIAPSDYHYYSGMGPGMLGHTYAPDDIRFATRKVVEAQGGVFVRDRAVKIDPERREVFTQSGTSLGYDVLSFNAGSYVPLDTVSQEIPEAPPDNLYPVKPIEKLMEASQRLEKLFREKKAVVSVVGGGPSAAEVAGNVWQLAHRIGANIPVIRIFAGKGFMKRFAPGVRKRVRRILVRREIEIIETGYVDRVEADKILMGDRVMFPTDFTFMALGVIPSTIFEASGLPTGPDRGLLVNEYLQSPDYPEIFGGGDCIYHQPQPLDKVGVYAVRENPVLLHNLMAALEGRPLEKFDPGPDYLLIFNVGGGEGVLKKHGLIFGGRLAFFIKDYIDRRFIKRFQAIEATL
ncbi:MAG: FAD-dependent oxidoreductase [Desulfobacter sp.]|nr:MAG: FAD-dependent oxidoreductase [Desulfobacter sp.]